MKKFPECVLKDKSKKPEYIKLENGITKLECDCVLHCEKKVLCDFDFYEFYYALRCHIYEIHPWFNKKSKDEFFECMENKDCEKYKNIPIVLRHIVFNQSSTSTIDYNDILNKFKSVEFISCQFQNNFDMRDTSFFLKNVSLIIIGLLIYHLLLVKI